MTPDEFAELAYRPCVGVMLASTRGQVFVGQRIDTETPAWQMPQGGIDPGEAPRAAALRELSEETGIPPEMVTVEAETEGWISYDLPQHIVPRIWNGQYRGQKQKWFLMRFHGADADVDIATGHPEFSEWRWLNPEDLVDRIVPFKRAVYARVLEEFRELI